MKVLGIDPGQKRLGLASISIKNGEMRLDNCGVLHHERGETQKFNDYLNEGIFQICEVFPQMLHAVKPHFIMAEIVPTGRLGANTELNVAAITVCKVIAWQWGIDWYDIAANTVKKTVTGDGKATKAKIKKAVVERFPNIKIDINIFKQKEGGQPEELPQDLYDAIAIAWAGLMIYDQQEAKD